MGTYIPTTVIEKQKMLEDIGYHQIEDLFSGIPEEVLFQGELNLPKGRSELEVRRILENISNKNKIFTSIFRGAGAYHHYIPALVKQITSKEEFITAYTPYQAEISQGLLQSIFEYQTMICELTGLDVSNASVYDGATAAAEAVNMCKERKRTKAIISAATNPQVIHTIETYCSGNGIDVIVLPSKEGRTDIEALRDMADKETACIYIQHPNFYGQLEDVDAIKEITNSSGAKYIVGCNPISLAILKTPGEFGADIAVGEGQPLGLPLSFGGPYIGFMASTDKMMRRLPGRIVGETKDINGKRAYVLTLQAREQHIRREKASSNICSNQALCALTTGVYMSTMGKEGMKQVATQCMSKAHYFADEISRIKGFELIYQQDFFHEFVTNAPKDVEIIMDQLAQKGILGGYPLEGKEKRILWCATEMNTKEEIDSLIQILREVASV